MAVFFLRSTFFDIIGHIEKENIIYGRNTGKFTNEIQRSPHEIFVRIHNKKAVTRI
jgi:hypothetical protein